METTEIYKNKKKITPEEENEKLFLIFHKPCGKEEKKCFLRRTHAGNFINCHAMFSHIFRSFHFFFLLIFLI